MGKLTFWKRISLTAAVGLVAACGGGSGGSGQTSLPVDLPNNPPQIVGTPVGTALVGQLYRFTPSATDADGDTLTFRIENRPDWATFSPSTGRLDGHAAEHGPAGLPAHPDQRHRRPGVQRTARLRPHRAGRRGPGECGSDDQRQPDHERDRGQRL